MPTRITLSCPSCGLVETCNYLWPDEQGDYQPCPFCKSESKLVSAVIVPQESAPRIVEPITGDNIDETPKKSRKQRK